MNAQTPLLLQPIGLSRDESARFIGIKPTLFDQLVADGRMPPPLRINRRRVWSRIEIESAFASLSTDAVTAETDDENEWDDV